MYMLTSSVSALVDKLKKKEAVAAPVPKPTKTCIFCDSEISKVATRCPNCTSVLEDKGKQDK